MPVRIDGATTDASRQTPLAHPGRYGARRPIIRHGACGAEGSLSEEGASSGDGRTPSGDLRRHQVWCTLRLRNGGRGMAVRSGRVICPFVMVALGACGGASEPSADTLPSSSTTSVVLRTSPPSAPNTSPLTTTPGTTPLATTTVSPTTEPHEDSSVIPPDPWSSPNCADGVEMATVDLSAGTMRIVDAGDRFCLLRDRAGPVEISMGRARPPCRT
jgi:hypothetical protein